MEFITIVGLISAIIFIISCVTIYHNTNSFEPVQRVVYIIVGTVVVYFITSAICSMCTKGINIKSEEALNDTVTVMKLIFTPVNSLIILSTLGNIFGKMKDQSIGRR